MDNLLCRPFEVEIRVLEMSSATLWGVTVIGEQCSHCFLYTSLMPFTVLIDFYFISIVTLSITTDTRFSEQNCFLCEILSVL